MSYRARLEEIRSHQQQDEIDAIERKRKAVQDRIHSPIVWGTWPDGIKIQDLAPDLYGKVIDVIKDSYIPNEVLPRNANIKNEPDSLESYLYLVHYNLRDRKSIIAIDESVSEAEIENDIPNEDVETEETEAEDVENDNPDSEDEDEAENIDADSKNIDSTYSDAKEMERGKKTGEEKGVKIAGFIIIREVAKAQYTRIFNRVQPVKGEGQVKINKYMEALNRSVDIYSQFNCDTYLEYYMVYIMPNYRKTVVGNRLFETGFEVARTLNMKVVMGIFDNSYIQKLAARYDMIKCNEILYTRWTTPLGQPIFCDPGPGNYSAVVMVGKVPKLEEDDEGSTNLADVQSESQRKLSKQDRKETKSSITFVID